VLTIAPRRSQAINRHAYNGHDRARQTDKAVVASPRFHARTIIIY